jgi:hypothetical protein
MTALNGTSGLKQDTGELTALPGLKAVSEQLAGLIAVLRAKQARRQVGIQISRPTWSPRPVPLAGCRRRAAPRL